MATPDDIAAEGKADPDRPSLKGGGRQVVKEGDFTTANADFDRLRPTDVSQRSRGIRTGMIADGRMAIVRPVSEPTLEIQSQGVPDLKIRYRL